MNIDQIKQEIETHFGPTIFESKTQEEIQLLGRTFNTVFGEPVFDVLVTRFRAGEITKDEVAKTILHISRTHRDPIIADTKKFINSIIESKRSLD
jgi:hypothetical protein